MEDRRWIWKDASHIEPVTVQQLYYEATHEKINNQTPFWSERLNQWLPLTHLFHDIFPDRERSAKMRGAGIRYVKIIGSGDDCDACRKLNHRIYSIDAVPELPPSDCTCKPRCGCLIVALPF